MTCTDLTNTHTHRHTYSEETEESLFYFSVVFFYILLESKIGGFQYHFILKMEDGILRSLTYLSGGHGRLPALEKYFTSCILNKLFPDSISPRALGNQLEEKCTLGTFSELFTTHV